MQPDSMSLVMEYVPHGNLFQSIQHDSKGTLQWWDRGRHVALDIAKGLAYLHSRKVCVSLNVCLSCHTATIIASDKTFPRCKLTVSRRDRLCFDCRLFILT